MIRALAVGIASFATLSVAAASPGARCDGDACIVDPGPRPWILSDDCRDDTDVVGYRHCGSFGRWASGAHDPQLVFEAGVGARPLTMPSVDGAHRTARTVAAGGPSPRGGIALTAPLRVLGVVRAYDAGLEVELGDLAGRTVKRGGLLQTGGVFGRTAALGPLDLGAEVFLGGRRLRGTFDRTRPMETVAVFDAAIEARGRLGVWLSPWLTLTGAVGADVVHSEWSGALLLGFHTRAFGGRPR